MDVVENHQDDRKPARGRVHPGSGLPDTLPSDPLPPDPPQSGIWTSARRWWGPVVLFAIVVLFYWKLTLTRQFTWLATPDLANQVMPWFQLQAGEWHARRFPLWDPYIWGGQPLFGQMQPGSAYPLNWLL